MIYNNHSKTIKSIARDMRVSEFLIRQLVHEDIRFLSFRLRKGQLLLHATKDKKEGCQFLQNNRWLAQQGVSILMKTKHLVLIMMFKRLACDDGVISSVIILHCLRLNGDASIKCLEEVVLSWIKKEAVGRSYIWQQVSGPCHSIRRPSIGC